MGKEKQTQNNTTICYRIGKLKCSIYKPLHGLPSQIDLPVNKLEYKNYNINPLSLDYPLYLDPPSLNYQRASLSLVYQLFKSRNYHQLHPSQNGMTQCFPKAPKQLTTLKMGVVCVLAENFSKNMEFEREESEENYEKCVEDCRFAISNS